MKNILLICCSAFGFTQDPTWLNVINYGTKQGDKLTYTTKEGTQIKTPEEITVPNFIKVFDLSAIDMQKSLSSYFKTFDYFPDQIVNDQEIMTGEIYTQNCWVYPLLLLREGNKLTFKILFDY